MRVYLSLLLAGLFLTTAVAAEAHHSASSFWYTDRSVSIEGVVKSVAMVNPHPEMVVTVTNPDGTHTDWYISGGGNASAMIRAGWTQDTLTPGMAIKVEGAPSRREGAKALLSGDVTIQATGRVLDFSSGSDPITDQ